MKYLYEILVPTTIDNKILDEEYHKIWDSQVCDISGGLTIFSPSKGYWISQHNKLFVEKMIPVRIYCTPEDINRIADLTAAYYRQQAIMYYIISVDVQVKHYN